MIQDELALCIRSTFGHQPTGEQELAIRQFCLFLTDRHPHAAMLMRGCAGTGKTTLAGAIVRALKALGQKVVLMAPTGRAAKVFALNADSQAYTIHHRIYRSTVGVSLADATFHLNENLHTDTLFIVDEASMIANSPASGSSFGSGCLLDDLVQYVYTGRNCRMMFIGDAAQLPPVGQEQSPALQASVLSGYGLKVYVCDLDEVLRQSADSGILYNATLIRSYMEGGLPKIRLKGFADVVVVPGSELIEQLTSSYSAVGIDDTTVVTRSNKRCNIYNQGIRNTILDREDVLCTGDRLMVVKNNYFWGIKEQKSEGDISFIANGDQAVVERVRHVRELYGFTFADVWLRFPDYDDSEVQATVILDSLTTEAPALTQEQQQQLFLEVMADYADIPHKADRLKALKMDAHYNALQVKYAYAVTCHKAQGGQWAHVYLDQGYMTDDMLTPDYIHWLYTAFTRATEKLFLVNWPKTQIE